MHPWVENLSFMKQTLLITAVRGPDGIRKHHTVKILLRWLRRCILYDAISHTIYNDPYQSGGGSFLGPCDLKGIDAVRDEYFDYVDELPHHFQMHFIHASEILGYDYPNIKIREWWKEFYLENVRNLHLIPEIEETMDHRLKDYKRKDRNTCQNYTRNIDRKVSLE